MIWAIMMSNDNAYGYIEGRLLPNCARGKVKKRQKESKAWRPASIKKTDPLYTSDFASWPGLASS